MRSESDLRREANMRKLYDDTMAADPNGRHGQSIYEIQKAAKQVEEDLRRDGVLQGPNREAAMKTVIGGYMSHAGFDPEYLDGDTPKSQIRFKNTLYDAHERKDLHGEVIQQANTMTQDRADRTKGGSRAIEERVAADMER